MTGEGEPGPAGGPNGDLFIDIIVKPHPLLERHGVDLMCAVPITFTQAALGAVVDVPTLAGPEQMDVPRGTQSGDMIRMMGKGMPHLNGGPRGDQIVVITVETPARLTREQEKLLRQLAATEDVSVFPRRKSFFKRFSDCFREEK